MGAVHGRLLRVGFAGDKIASATRSRGSMSREEPGIVSGVGR